MLSELRSRCNTVYQLYMLAERLVEKSLELLYNGAGHKKTFSLSGAVRCW